MRHLAPIRIAALVCLGTVLLAAQRYSFASFGQDNGLQSLAISALAEDPAGYLWIATEDGLYRFGAGQFRRFGPAEGITNSFNYNVHVDGSGRVWDGTDEGLFVGQSQGFTAVRANGRLFAVNPDSAFADLPDGDELVVANWRLLRVHRGADGGYTASDFLAGLGLKSPGYVGGVILRRDGSIWFGCGTEICVLRGRNLSTWSAEHGVPGERWRQFFEASDGTLWVRNGQHILALGPGGERGERFQAREEGLPAARANDGYWTFVEDRAHRILTPVGGQLARYDGGRWEMLGRAQGLPAFAPSALLLDQRGDLWMGVVGHGLAHWLGYGNFSAWTTDEGLSSSIVWSVLQTDPHTVWIATELGLDRLDPTTGRIASWSRRLGPTASSLHYIRRDSRGNIWFVNALGAVAELTAKGEFRQAGRVGGKIINVTADREGRVWLTANPGLWVVQDGGAPRQIHDPALAAVTAYYNIREDPRGGLWLSTRSGLFHNVGGGWKKVALGGFHLDPHFQNIAPMGDGSVWATDAEHGLDHLWIADDKVQRVESVDTPTLASEQNMFLVRDARGWLWVGNDHGVDVYNGTLWRRASTGNGLLWNDVDNHAFDAAADGSAWIGTSAGLAHIAFPERLFDPLTLRLTATLTPAPPYPAAFSAMGEPNYRSVIYRYRLVGLEPAWTTTADPRVRYPSLPAGRYTLEVEAVDTAQHVTSNRVAIPLRVAPPWWRSVPMIALWCLIAGLLLYVVSRWRVRALVARQRELEALVAERTRELEALATHDGLTGVLNRGAIFERLGQELDRCAREGARMAVVLADLDHFKAINDRLGHRRGDAALVHAAERFQAGMRQYDSVGRYGGEEFLLLLPGLEEAEGARRLEELRRSFEREPLAVEGSGIGLTCSFGVAWVDGEADLEEVLERADKALYAAKSGGRNRVVVA